MQGAQRLLDAVDPHLRLGESARVCLITPGAELRDPIAADPAIDREVERAAALAQRQIGVLLLAEIHSGARQRGHAGVEIEPFRVASHPVVVPTPPVKHARESVATRLVPHRREEVEDRAVEDLRRLEVEP